MTVKELDDTIGGNYENAKKIMMSDALISRFIVKLIDDPSYARLTEARRTMNAEELFSAAHGLKGVWGNLGLTSLSNAAAEITEEFRSGNSRTLSDEEVLEKLDNIDVQYRKTIAGIRQFAEEAA